MDGIYREYHENGQLQEEVNYIDDKRNGIYKSYWKNGQLCEEVNYIDDKRNGIYKSYYDNGQLWVEVNYIDDKKNGIYKSYHKNGQLKKEVNYIDGKENGIYKLYYYHGQLYEDGECFMDEYIKYTRYHDNGYKCAEYYSNRDDSIYYNKIYNENGILEEEIYAQDEKEFQNKILKHGNYI